VQPYLVPTIEFFDRASVPPQIQELLDEWPDIDPGTARLIRAAVMSRDPRRLRQAWGLLYARVELARVVQSDWRGAERLEPPAAGGAARSMRPGPARRLSGGR